VQVHLSGVACPVAVPPAEACFLLPSWAAAAGAAAAAACLQVWKKVLPLGLVFFVASFNLTILQASGGVGKTIYCSDGSDSHGSPSQGREVCDLWRRCLTLPCCACVSLPALRCPPPPAPSLPTPCPPACRT
jgi:hypothetical protein